MESHLPRSFIAKFTILAVASVPNAALAHAHLRTASPAPKSIVQIAPREVAIEFTEEVEPKFSSIVVKDSTGAEVDQGDVHIAPDDAKHLAVSLKPLPSGTYTVIWHATATDMHKTDGTYSFQLKN